MKAVLIGSAVYRNKFQDNQDVDLVADSEFATWLLSNHPAESSEQLALAKTYVTKIEGSLVEVRVPLPNTAHALLLDAADTPTEILGLKIYQASLPMLAALKKAHLIVPHKWGRQIEQYRRIKDMLGVKEFDPGAYGPDVYNIYRQHRKEIKKFAKAHPKLNVSKNNFFEEAEFKIFDHDTIHKAVALGSVPAYTLMQDGEVWCSKEKWQALDDEQKMRCVIEEASVLALERSIIPALFLGKAFRGAQWAYEFALEKISTTITSGWFRDYCIEHYFDAKERRPDFVDKFFEGLKHKTVKVLKPEVVGSVAE